VPRDGFDREIPRFERVERGDSGVFRVLLSANLGGVFGGRFREPREAFLSFGAFLLRFPFDSKGRKEARVFADQRFVLRLRRRRFGDPKAARQRYFIRVGAFFYVAAPERSGRAVPKRPFDPGDFERFARPGFRVRIPRPVVIFDDLGVGDFSRFLAILRFSLSFLALSTFRRRVESLLGLSTFKRRRV
jgi:hypothetical protein